MVVSVCFFFCFVFFTTCVKGSCLQHVQIQSCPSSDHPQKGYTIKSIRHQKLAEKQWFLKHHLFLFKKTFLDLCNSNLPNQCFLFRHPEATACFWGFASKNSFLQRHSGFRVFASLFCSFQLLKQQCAPIFPISETQKTGHKMGHLKRTGFLQKIVVWEL